MEELQRIFPDYEITKVRNNRYKINNDLTIIVKKGYRVLKDGKDLCHHEPTLNENIMNCITRYFKCENTLENVLYRNNKLIRFNVFMFLFFLTYAILNILGDNNVLFSVIFYSLIIFFFRKYIFNTYQIVRYIPRRKITLEVKNEHLAIGDQMFYYQDIDKVVINKFFYYAGHLVCLMQINDYSFWYIDNGFNLIYKNIMLQIHSVNEKSHNNISLADLIIDNDDFQFQYQDSFYQIKGFDFINLKYELHIGEDKQIISLNELLNAKLFNNSLLQTIFNSLDVHK